MGGTDRNIGTLTADGSTEWYPIRSVDRSSRGSVTIAVEGSFGGGAIAIEGARSDGGEPLNLGDGATLDSSGAVILDFPALSAGNEWHIRVTLTGATAPSLSSYIA